MKNKNKKFIFLLIGLALLVPFWLLDFQESNNAVKVEESSVGYYQSTTCSISFLDTFSLNSNNENTIRYNNNDYVGIECFGKITGLDLVGDIFIVSIGTNSSLSFLIQAIVWCLLILLIREGQSIKKVETNYLIVFLPIIFTFQYFFESRFYSQTDIYFNNLVEGGNYYIFIRFLIYYLIFLFFSQSLQKRASNLINYLPYSFLLVGTFLGSNINFYILILAYFGFQNLIDKNFNLKWSSIYFLFSIFWINTRRDNNSFFDTDKLRGYINSSNNLESLAFWIIIFWLILNGINYLYLVSNINKETLVNSFLISGSLIVILGHMGAISPFFNFSNSFIFGQNKRGINAIESIAGNTWRGYSASAESIGEFFAFVIIIYFFFTVNRTIQFNKQHLAALIVVLFGLIRSNNFAAISSSILLITIFCINKFIKEKRTRYAIYSFLIILLIGLLIVGLNQYSYSDLSMELLYEASLHSNLMENEDNYTKAVFIQSFFDEESLDGLAYILKEGETSKSLTFLFDIYNGSFNIPFIPNIVSLIAVLAAFINRSEMWGIFIAKYSPNLTEALFGNGPQQLNNYLYAQKVRLDLPAQNLTSLFLPHSSVLDLLIFIGVLGCLIVFIYSIFVLKIKSNEIEYKYLLIFILVNIAKSDSILYINSVMLIALTYFMVLKSKKENI
tara:strand:+ start:1259 stop:3277 length:2019 start_codon:yes stop_codon:yes gene_type:complete